MSMKGTHIIVYILGMLFTGGQAVFAASPAGRHDSCSQQEVHLKDFTRNHLDSKECFPWFNKEYTDYVPQREYVDTLKSYKNSLKVVAIGGSWCSDTQHLLPELYKITDQVGIPPGHIQLIGVDRDKKDAFGKNAYDVKLVPTFIFYLKGKEIGRIVETSPGPLEEEIVKLIKQG